MLYKEMKELDEPCKVCPFKDESICQYDNGFGEALCVNFHDNTDVYDYHSSYWKEIENMHNKNKEVQAKKDKAKLTRQKNKHIKYIAEQACLNETHRLARLSYKLKVLNVQRGLISGLSFTSLNEDFINQEKLKIDDKIKKIENLIEETYSEKEKKIKRFIKDYKSK